MDYDRPTNLPLQPPKFTLKDIKDAIPSHCFERNLLTSLSHLLSDLVIVAIFGYLATGIGNVSFLPAWSPYVLWPVYWYSQGCGCACGVVRRITMRRIHEEIVSDEGNWLEGENALSKWWLLG